MKPRIFISAVTTEFGRTRQLVANVLSRLGYDPVTQDIFGTESGDLRQMLRDKIDDCDGLIQLVGRGYGAEPPTVGASVPDAPSVRDTLGDYEAEFAQDGFTRVSYTQFEFLYARAKEKKSRGRFKTWLIYTDEGCTLDHPLDELDLPRDPTHPDPAGYQSERRALQETWRQRWKQEGHLRHAATSDTELELKVERLKDEFAELRRAEHAWRRKVAWSLAAVAALVLLSVGVGMYVAEKQRQAANAVQFAADEAAKEAKITADRAKLDQQKMVQTIKSSTQETKEGIKVEIQKAVHELTNPVVLAERIRKEIHATAEAKIKALPDEKGRGRLVAEIEKERDLALGRVDDLIKLIQEGLKEGASPVFQRAAEILQKEGTDEALAYLESRRPSTLETARRHAEQAKTAQARADAEKELRNKSLQPLVLEAELLETKLQWQLAIELRQQVAELAPDWFEARNSLGLLHFKLGHFAVAEPHQRATLKLAVSADEEAISLNNLALLLQATNRLAEAEPLLRRALAIDEQTYGTDHPRVAISLSNLSMLLKKTNRLIEAEKLIRRAVAIDEWSYGERHHKVARHINNLATLLFATNRLSEAEPLMRRGLAIEEGFRGGDHPFVATQLNNLAQLLQATNDLAEAELLYRRALIIDEQSYGTEHLDVARDLNNLAWLLKEMSRLAEAEPLMRRGLAIEEGILGGDHPSVAIPLNNLAQLLKATNRLEDAEPLIRRTLVINEQSYGAEHPNVALGLGNLASLLQETNRLEDAEPLMRRTLAINEHSYGAEHPNVARDLSNLASLLYTTDHLVEAEPLMRRALAIDQQTYGTEHRKVATRLNNLAWLLRSTDRLEEAETLMRHALAIDERSYGPEHPDVAINLDNLAQLLQETNRLMEAEPLMRRALNISINFKHQTGYVHPSFQQRLDGYRDLLQELNVSPDEIVQKVKGATESVGPLKPLTPEVERLLGASKSVAEVMAGLDRQYKEEEKPPIYFLRLNQPIAPHLEELLRPNSDSRNEAGVSAYRNGAHAEAIVLYDESLKLMANNPDRAATTFTTRMNRAAALRELGEVEQARDELRRLMSGLKERDTITALAKGRAHYHLALCECRLRDRDAAKRDAEESLKEYGDDDASAAQKKQTEQLLADLKDNKPLPPLAKVDAVAALEQARGRFRARADLATLPLNQSAIPLLDQMLGPAKSTKEVFETLDRQYREQHKPPVWFLPLSEPIAPHLDELLGPVPSEPK